MQLHKPASQDSNLKPIQSLGAILMPNPGKFLTKDTLPAQAWAKALTLESQKFEPGLLGSPLWTLLCTKPQGAVHSGQPVDRKAKTHTQPQVRKPPSTHLHPWACCSSSQLRAIWTPSETSAALSSLFPREDLQGAPSSRPSHPQAPPARNLLL